MIACVDVFYHGDTAVAACVLIATWEDPLPREERVCVLPHTAPYQSGQFFRRELLPIVRVLGTTAARPDMVVIDGYVWLSTHGRPGLGAHLYQALSGSCAVIGVAKTRFGDVQFALPLFRGQSRKPLYVTGVGIEPHQAAECVARMHGPNRIPTILRRADYLSRNVLVAPSPSWSAGNSFARSALSLSVSYESTAPRCVETGAEFSANTGVDNRK